MDIYLSIYLSIIYPSYIYYLSVIYLSMYLCIYLSYIYYLSIIYLSVYLSIYWVSQKDCLWLRKTPNELFGQPNNYLSIIYLSIY